MPSTRPIISKKTRQLIREYFVGTTLAEIRDEFDAADIAADLEHDPQLNGERRTLVEQYYTTLDFARWSDVRKFLSVAENVLMALTTGIETTTTAWVKTEVEATRTNILRSFERDGFDYKEGRLTPVGSGAGIETDTHHFDLPELRRQVQRMRDAVDNDPGLAIGTAKELVETTCKTILNDRAVTFEKDATMTDLVKAVRKTLKLLPDDIPDAAKGVETIRRLLSNLGTVGQGVAELRGLYGTGHGKDGRHSGVPPRIARLAVGSAAALATFLLETHEERE